MPHSVLALHPDNPHYFIFRGKPTVLITSGEHYSAVMNLEFDYVKYLNTLRSEGLNHTRLFVGVYRELPNEWWPMNPLGPRPGQFACPFGRSEMTGARDGGHKFDLDKWDTAFFERLDDFFRVASGYGIVIEVNLFCPFYVTAFGEKFWELSPWHADNNINALGFISPTEVYTLMHPRFVEYQEAMVRKIVQSLNPYDNLYFEVCNEPYFDNISLEWQEHIAEVIQEEERSLPVQHLISRNVANFWAEIQQPHPAFSIFNFHYPRPEMKCVVDNYHLNKVIGCNETGFDGAADETYRIQGWQFMLAGGGLFNHLDASFWAGDESGSQLPAGTEKFAGGPVLRRQIRILKDFIESFDFIHMAPYNSTVIEFSDLQAIYVLAKPGQQYAIYVVCTPGKACHALELRALTGQYTVEYVDVCSGKTTRPETVYVVDGTLRLALPAFQPDLAIRVFRKVL